MIYRNVEKSKEVSHLMLFFFKHKLCQAKPNFLIQQINRPFRQIGSECQSVFLKLLDVSCSL